MQADPAQLPEGQRNWPDAKRLQRELAYRSSHSSRAAFRSSCSSIVFPEYRRLRRQHVIRVEFLSWPGEPPPQVETEVFFPFILGDDHRVRGVTLAADRSHLRKQLAVARQHRRHGRLIACGRSSKQPDRERM